VAAETIETKFLMTAQNRASAVINAMRGDLDRATGAIKTFSGALGAIGVGASAAVFAAQAKSAIDLADQLDDLAQRTGIAVDSLSVLKYAAQFAGVGFDELQTSLRFYNQRVSDAAGGNKEALSTFERLGLSQKDVQAGLSDSEGLLRKVFDEFSKYSEGAARSALASDIFGSRNEKMAQLLAIGSRGLSEQRKELEQFGSLIGPEFAARAAEFNDNLDRLGALSQAAGIALGERLVPQLNAVVNAFIQAKREGDGFLSAVQRAFQAATIGTDQQINDSRLSSLTDQLLKQERIVAEARANAERPNQSARAAMKRRYDAEVAELERLQAEIQTTLTYRKQLEGEAAKGSSSSSGTQLPKPAATSGGADQGQAFLDQLRKRLVVVEQNEYAALRLEAAQKKVSTTAEPLIQQLERETEFRKQLAEAQQRDQQVADAEISRRQGLVNSVGDYVKGLDQETEVMKLANDQRLVAVQLLKLEEAGLQKNTAEYQAAKAAIEGSVDANSAAKIFEETRTPIERYQLQLKRLNDLADKGAIDWDTYERAVRRAEEGIEGFGDAIDKTKSLSEELGPVLSSSFEDAAFSGGKLRDIVKGLGLDIAKLLFRRNVTKPVVDAIGGFDWGALFSSIFSSANGNIMSSGGPLSLQAFAGGGIASRATLALYGEGSMNEAIIPLPDGRHVPVMLRGGGGGQSVSVVVNNNAAPDTMASAQVRNDGMRGLTVEVLVERIESMQSRRIQQGGGLAPVLERQYGLSRTAGAYR